MSSPSSLLLHVGYHKTATTWMQQHLFVPVHGFRQVAEHQTVFDLVLRPVGPRFDPGPMRDLIARARADLAPGEVPVISSEILSGHPFLGGRESDVFAERLHRIAPEARILISIRDQMRILPSVYMQYLQRGGTMPPARFFEGTSRPGYFGFAPEHFEYDVLTAQYQALFGKENVYLQTQEALLADMGTAAAGIARFAGATGFAGLADSARRVHAPGYPEYAVPVLRRMNHVQASTLNPTPIIALGTTPGGLFRAAGYALRRRPVARLLAGHRPVSAYVSRRFAGRYTTHNNRLREISAHPLDLDGYC